PKVSSSRDLWRAERETFGRTFRRGQETRAERKLVRRGEQIFAERKRAKGGRALPAFSNKRRWRNRKARGTSRNARRPTAGLTFSGSWTQRKRKRASGGCAKPSRVWRRARAIRISLDSSNRP